MRILHLVHRYAPYVGGSEEVVRQMSERLDRRGNDVTVLTRGTLPTPGNGVEVRDITGPRDYRRKLDLLTREADILMVFGQKVWCSDWLPLARVHCPVVYFPVGFDSWSKGLLHRLYYETWQRYICGRADALIALTEREEGFLRSWIQHPKLVRIPMGIDFGYWQEPAASKPPVVGPFLLHAGGYYDNKRVTDLVEVTAKVQQRGLDVGLVTCGPDFRRNREMAQGLAEARGVQGYLALESVSPAELKGLYQGCAVYVSPSSFEGFGLAFLEALASGKPLVCRPVGVAPELLQKTGNVRVAEDVDGLAEHVAHFLQEGCNPENSRSVAMEFDWEKVVDQVEELYHDVMRGRA